MALVMAQEVPTSSTMVLPHGPSGVGAARQRLRKELFDRGTPGTVVDDAVLILSELLSNAYRHARPIESLSSASSASSAAGRNGAGPQPSIRAAWHLAEDGLLILEVTDGGGPTRPMPSSPSLTARGGRGLGIVGSLALDWGVREDAPGEVTVWACLPVRGRHARRDGLRGSPRLGMPAMGPVPGLAELFDELP